MPTPSAVGESYIGLHGGWAAVAGDPRYDVSGAGVGRRPRHNKSNGLADLLPETAKRLRGAAMTGARRLGHATTKVTRLDEARGWDFGPCYPAERGGPIRSIVCSRRRHVLKRQEIVLPCQDFSFGCIAHWHQPNSRCNRPRQEVGDDRDHQRRVIRPRAASRRRIGDRRGKMKAVTCTNAKLEVVDQPTPTPAKGQLLIDVLRCGICGSDLHARHHCDELADVMVEIRLRRLHAVESVGGVRSRVLRRGRRLRSPHAQGPAARHTGRCVAAAPARQGGARDRAVDRWRRAPTPSRCSSSSRSRFPSRTACRPRSPR